MKRIIYKPTGDVSKADKAINMIRFNSKERTGPLHIGNSPVDVSDREYDVLKKGAFGADIVIFNKKTKMSKPIEIDLGGKKQSSKKVK